MNKDLLIKDAAIIAVLLIVGALIYFSFPSQTEPRSTAKSAALSTNTNTQTMPSSGQTAQLQIQVLKEGTGPGAVKGQTLSVNYTGKLADGTVFDSSIPRGQPFSVTLGAGQVIPGWEMGLQGMKVGEERRLIIPPELAYGIDGFPGAIPPNATLTFDVELLATH